LRKLEKCPEAIEKEAIRKLIAIDTAKQFYLNNHQKYNITDMHPIALHGKETDGADSQQNEESEVTVVTIQNSLITLGDNIHFCFCNHLFSFRHPFFATVFFQ
jgi:hypothetical protein